MTEMLAGRRSDKSVTSPHTILVIRNTVVNILSENDQTQRMLTQQYTYHLIWCHLDVGITRININP